MEGKYISLDNRFREGNDIERSRRDSKEKDQRREENLMWEVGLAE